MTGLAFNRGLWLLLGTAVVVAVISRGWLVQTTPPTELPEAAPAKADYYLRDAEVDVMDENGRLSYRLKTDELLRFGDHSSRLTNVDIVSLGGKDGVWRLEAGQANITENQELMLLSGGVKMQTEGPQGRTLLVTQTLKVELKNNRMDTNDPVRIEGPEFQTQAVGMQAGFKSRNLTLLNKVQTRYAR
jgi:LPS export ABC transporter protein LptC